MRSLLALFAAFGAFVACLSGCAADPFTRRPLPVLEHPDPAAIRDEFAAHVAPRFTSDDTVIIHAPFHGDIAVLGVLRVDRPGDTFELLGLNHLGLELFQLGGSGQNVTIRSAVPPLMDRKNVLLSIGADTRRMYFDLTPSPDARAEIRPTLVRFIEQTPEGRLIYEFGDQPVVLLEKRLEGLLGTQWRVRYYDYDSADGDDAGGAIYRDTKLYPRGIVMENGRFHYRIVVKNRQWQAK